MPPFRNILAVALLGCLAPTVPSNGPARAQAPADTSAAPTRVITDSTEYCDRLHDRVAQAEQAHREAAPRVEGLAEEGHHMCAAGRIRAGLLRLRRALLMLGGD